MLGRFLRRGARPAPIAGPPALGLPGVRLLVAIAHHHAPERLPFLLEVARALGDFAVDRLDVVVITNLEDAGAREAIRRLLRPVLAVPGDVEVIPAGRLEHPFHLPWSHKPLISERFLAGQAWTHFIYLEDDIRFGFAAFRHFLAARPLLAPHGLVPGFFRVEFSAAKGALHALDQTAPFDAAARPGIDAGGLRFVAAPNPYCAMYVLDRDLAEEHVADPAFDREASRQISTWEVRERAAMGLCWSRVPNGFSARQVIAVDPVERIVMPGCLVGHLAGNYADDPARPFGKVPLAAVLDPRAWPDPGKAADVR